MNIVSASLLSADFTNLKGEIKRTSLAQWLHLDIMDGHFVPNISMGLPIVSAVRRLTNQILDVHLMLSDPIVYVDAFAEAGSDLITFHLESRSDPEKTIERIHLNKKKAGLVLKPETDICGCFPYLDKLDVVLVMAVEPGFGGQRFSSLALGKIRALRREIDARGLAVAIEVDGGVTMENASQCVQAGATVLVSGSSVFLNPEPEKAIRALQLAANNEKTSN